MEPNEVLQRLRAEFPGLEWEKGWRLSSKAFVAKLPCPLCDSVVVSIIFYLNEFVAQWESSAGDIGTIDDAIAQLKTWIRDYAHQLLKAIGEGQ